MPKTDAISGIRAQEGRAKVLRLAKVILWDEASMVPLAAFDCAFYVATGIPISAVF